MTILLNKKQFKKFLEMGLCPSHFGVDKGVDQCFGNMDKWRCMGCWERAIKNNNALVETPIKVKFPLAIDTIKFPVRYRKADQSIADNKGREIFETKGWEYIQHLSDPDKRHDQIGEIVVFMLNKVGKET